MSWCAIWSIVTPDPTCAGTTDDSGSEALPFGLFLATLKGAAGVGGAILWVAGAVQDGGCTASIGGISPILSAAPAFPMLGCVLCLLLLRRTSA